MEHVGTLELLSGLAVVAATGLSYFILFRRSADPDADKTYDLTLKCKCGKVKADIVVPPSSRYSKQTNLYCCCNDCVGFAKYVQSKRDDKSSEVLEKEFTSVHMVQFYKSDLKFTQGLDLIVPCKLRKGTHVYRYYSSCCNTPLLLQAVPQFFPYVVIYSNLLEPANIYERSNMVLFGSRLPADETIPEGMEVFPTIPLSFFRRVFGRIIYGRWYGKGNPNCLSELDHTKLEIVHEEE